MHNKKQKPHLSKIISIAAALTSIISTSGYPDSQVNSKPVLNWSCNQHDSLFETAKAILLRDCTKAVAEIQNLQLPPAFVDGHVFNNDPKKVASIKLAGLLRSDLPALAYCATGGPNEIASPSLHTLIDFFKKLEVTYIGDGSPIDEAHLIAVIEAFDLVNQKLSDDDRTRFNIFLSQLDSRLVHFWKGLHSNDTRRINNWMTESLVLESFSLAIQRNFNKLKLVRDALNRHLDNEYTMPAGWQARACGNLAKIGSYGSYDLQQRDAFTYHVKGMGRALELEALLPGTLTDATKLKILTALNLTRDYVLGLKKHNEFVCTTIEYDRNAAAAGVPGYQTLPWNPFSNRDVFRFGRLVFQSIRPWTTSFIGAPYPAWIPVFSACHGD